VEALRAAAWAGSLDAAALRRKEFDSLRVREDFGKLLPELEKRTRNWD
jgi:hypothetical protein